MPGRAGAATAFCLSIGLLAGCSTPSQVLDLRRSAGDLPARAELTTVPLFPQEENYCGPASLAMMLAWSGLAVTQDEVAPQVFTPGREGTLQADILAAARRSGRLAVPVGDLRTLLSELAAGNPVLVFRSTRPRRPAAVALRRRHRLRARARSPGPAFGAGGASCDPLETFERTWERAGHWALAVTAPDRLPATASAEAAVDAALGIERAERPADAAAAYAAITAKWPQTYAAWMGLGNTRYALQEFAPAEAAYRSAIGLRPDGPQAWNNLAYALAGQGRRAEAIAAAERAVALGGAEADPYRATLQELSAAPAS